jgi:hypothetical protein
VFYPQFYSRYLWEGKSLFLVGLREASKQEGQVVEDYGSSSASCEAAAFLFFLWILCGKNLEYSPSIEMAAQDTRTKSVDNSTFWRIIFPLLVLVTLLIVLFVLFAMPDWAIPCGDGNAVRRFASTVIPK